MTVQMPSPLPYGRHSIDDDDIAAVAACLRSDWLTGGPMVDRFEAAFAAAVGARHAIVCSSGTAALHLACLALRLEPGDAVIVPAVTFVATANAVRLTGAEVVFADVDPETALMRPADLENAVVRAREAGHRLRAVIPVHLAGQVVDLAAIRAIADRHRIDVIEDGCHALGAQYAVGAATVPVGACASSRMTVFSLHPVKSITMGEGGVVTTNVDTDAAMLRRLRNHGVVREGAQLVERGLADDRRGGTNPWYHEFPEVGLNYRASDLNCALGLSQLGKLHRFIGRRRSLASAYREALADLAPLVRPIPQVAGCNSAWHLLVVLIDFAAARTQRADLMRALAERGIATQVHYIPVPWQPCYRRRYGLVELPGAAGYYGRCLSLPLFPAMSEADVDRVVAGLAAVVADACPRRLSA